MALVTISDLSIRFRGPPLLDAVNCLIQPGQRIGLLGRNGAGKSTLLRLLSDDIEPDTGQIVFAPGTQVSLLPQDVPRDVRGSITEVVASGLPRRAADEAEHHESAWEDEHRVERILSRMSLDGETPFETLSSGMKRRVLLARALVIEPELLLLDEPTNHLDIQAIDWLEQFLAAWQTTLMFVTHDRVFLRKLATRILELDRGKLFDWSCDYETFLQRKEAALAAEEKQNALFDRKLAEEEVWIRQGIKARRTRNEGRVRALQAMRNERQQRQARPGTVRMRLHQDQRSGNLVASAEDVSFSYGDHVVFRGFSTAVMRGDKIGIIGPNGAGKTTLLRVLLGQLKPDEGQVRLGTNLQIAYFDQLRDELDENSTVQENVADGYDTVRIGGVTKHVIGYLRDFLFSPERARMQVRFLSGGERNRILLARLFAKPANVIVLDEPTNDLDTETLELLEELLVEYTGTVLLVSHDRAFLNNVATSTMVFEGPEIQEYVGGYDDWQRQRIAAVTETKADKQPAPKTGAKSTAAANRPSTPKAASDRLSYREQQELAKLPEAIEQMEAEIAALHDAMAAPEFYKQAGDEIARETNRLRELETQLADAYHRWEELEHRSG
jgi:ATP-binding cassette subfamily F protein uup